jgi:DNA-binding GntR family transcriptional regulator
MFHVKCVVSSGAAARGVKRIPGRPFNVERRSRCVKRLRRSNLSDDAYVAVKDLLLLGKRYEPGGKISVEELSREFGVSRTPLWGAINRLEAEGVVEIVPRQGVYLLNFDPARALEIYQAREALEGMAARLAATRARGRHLEIIRASVERQDACLGSADIDGYSAAALIFHQHIVAATSNRTLERLLGTVYAQMQAMRARTKYLPGPVPDSFDDHDRILRALVGRDPEAAEREARAHIRRLADEIVKASDDADTARPRRRAAAPSPST